MPKSSRDILAGLIFLVLGTAFAIAARGYDLGTAKAMGPGYFPHALGWLSAVLGAAIVAEGLLRGDGEALGQVPWRGIVLMLAAIVFFGFMVRRLGLAPTLLVSVLTTALASRRNGPATALLIALGLTALCVGIFVYALGLNLPLFGPWLRF